MYKQLLNLSMACFFVLALVGCASQANRDPLEGVNRGVYKFNDVTDKAVFKPIAMVYKTVAPVPVRTGFNNFFNNLRSITSVLNNLLQFKFANAFSETGRFVINSTVGLAGFIDVAGKDNVPVYKEDFGQTLGYWGLDSGAYLVLPFLGPSSVRDTAGLIFDTATTDPIAYTHNIGEIRLHNQLRAAQFTDRRTELLNATDLIDEASLDPYAFMRDAYLQRRTNLVQDNLVSTELTKDEFFEEENKPATGVAK